jgi:hypothetical protein
MTLVAQLCSSEWASVGDTHYFVVNKNDFTLKMWRSDGRSSGTTLIRTMP